MATEEYGRGSEYAAIVDKDFTDRLEAFNAAGLAQQSQAVSDRATFAVADGIRKYPQNNDGAPWIIAARAIGYEFYPRPGSTSRRANMLELARLVPDIELCWQEMSNAHDAYDVVEVPDDNEPPKPPERPNVTPARAASFISGFAFYALSKIQMATTMFMRDMGLQTDGLDESLRLDRAIAIGPWEVDMGVVERIHAALASNEELRLQVYRHLLGAARPYVEGSTKQQAKHSPVAAKRLAHLAAREERKAAEQRL